MADTYQTRNYNLDLLKILACIAVVGIHTLAPGTTGTKLFLYFLCGFAVPSFFASSGFVLLNRPKVTWKYSLQKVLAVLRVVVLWNVAVRLVYAIVRVVQGADPAAAFSPMLFLSQIWHSLLLRGTMFHFWYLGALMILFLLLPLLHKAVNAGGGDLSIAGFINNIEFRSGGKLGMTWADRWPRHRIIFWAVLWAVSAVIMLLSILKGEYLFWWLPMTFRIWMPLQFFLLGSILAYLVYWVRAHIPMWAHLLILAGVTALMLVYEFFLSRRFQSILLDNFYDSTMVMLFTVAVATLVLRLPLKEGLVRWIRNLSPLLLGVYAVHVPVRMIFENVVPLDAGWKSVLFFLFVTVVSFLFIALIRPLRISSLWLDL